MFFLYYVEVRTLLENEAFLITNQFPWEKLGVFRYKSVNFWFKSSDFFTAITAILWVFQ